MQSLKNTYKLKEIHIPYQYDTCKCSECISIRKRKENTQKLSNMEHQQQLGPNWKNILAGLGDQ